MSKIVEVKTHPVGVTLKKTLWTAHEELKDFSTILVEVLTDDGLTGVGRIHGAPMKSICEWVARLADVIRGMEATNTVTVWEKMFSLTSPRPNGMGGRDGQPAPFVRSARPQGMSAIAGIDIALWDIRGKSAGLPVYRLLGAENYRWSVIGVGYPMEFHMAAMAIILGGHVRVGLEDNIFVRRRVLGTNADLVAKVKRIAAEFVRDIATPDEARQMLGFKGLAGVNY